MFKFITLPSFILFCVVVLFPNCKSSGSDTTSLKDSLAAENANNKNVESSYSKYIIQPPDSDYTGDYIDKYPNGVIRFNGFFRFGQRHGQWMAFYEDGVLWSECFYDKGLRHGSSKVYFPNGKLQYEGWFKNDLRDSLWLFYDETGKEIDKRAYRNDEETGLVN